MLYLGEDKNIGTGMHAIEGIKKTIDKRQNAYRIIYRDIKYIAIG